MVRPDVLDRGPRHGHERGQQQRAEHRDDSDAPQGQHQGPAYAAVAAQQPRRAEDGRHGHRTGGQPPLPVGQGQRGGAGDEGREQQHVGGHPPASAPYGPEHAQRCGGQQPHQQDPCVIRFGEQRAEHDPHSVSEPHHIHHPERGVPVPPGDRQQTQQQEQRGRPGGQARCQRYRSVLLRLPGALVLAHHVPQANNAGLAGPGASLWR